MLCKMSIEENSMICKKGKLGGCDLNAVLRQDCIKIIYDSVIEITAWDQKHCQKSLYVFSVWCAIHEYRVKGLS